MTGPPPNTRAVFVVLEGIDGSGTTTQLELLTRRLRTLGRRVMPTREPSTGPVGRLLREILLGQHRNPDGTMVDGRAMALLFAADRRDHLAREIDPALAAGMDIVSDRYVLSSLAYQSEEADRAWVAALAAGMRVPDLTLLLDVPIEIAAERRLRAGRPVERYDGDSILARVAENYRRLAPSRSDRSDYPDGSLGKIVVIDASGTVEEVEQRVTTEVERLIGSSTRS